MKAVRVSRLCKFHQLLQAAIAQWSSTQDLITPWALSRRRVEIKDRFDIGPGLVDHLVQGRLRHGFIEVDEKQFLARDQSRTLARYEHHLIALVAAHAEMGKGVAQSLTVNDPKRRDESLFTA